MLDAYTVKKAIPRVVLAVIAINLSIYLCIAAIDITTIVGRGLHSLLVGPFIEPDSFQRIKIESNAVNTAGLVGVLGAGAMAGAYAVFIAGIGASFVGLLFLLLPLIVTIALIALAVLFTLIIRQGLLIFLTVISPVAIACYILPGTEKYFRQWWDLFLKTLLVYPIIAAIFAMSNVLAAILLTTANNGASMFPGNYFAQQTDAMEAMQILTAIIVLYLPLVLIPFAFKLAGGAIAAVMNVANSRASGLAGGLGQRIKRSKEDPNSLAGKYAHERAVRRADEGLTGRQLWARRPGFGEKRRQRIGAAKELDQFINREAAKDTHRAKLNAQDSDIQDSLVMSAAGVERNKRELAQRLTDSRSGRLQRGQKGYITQQEYERKMRAHALADQMGRTTANRQAAFLNQDRIKFSSGTGSAGYEDELGLAREIFGDNASVASAMNAHQAIATGIGRADLAQALYGVEPEDANPTRGSAKAGASQIMQGHESGVKGSLDDHIRAIHNPDATAEQKTQAAQFLANMLSTASSPYGGGNEANKRMVLEKRGDIERAFKTFAADEATQGSYLHADMQGPGRQVTTQQTNPVTGENVEVTQAVPGPPISGPDAAFARLQKLAQAEIDPAKASATGEPPSPQGEEK
jgi:hypothetical protein